MNVDVRVEDITEQLRSHQIPYVVVKREIAEGHLRTSALVPAATQPYHICQGPIDQSPQWSVDNGGSHVSIPMFPYGFAPQAELLVKFGMQFGAVAAARGFNADRLLIVMSTIYARPDNQPGYCVYAGVAFRQKE